MHTIARHCVNIPADRPGDDFVVVIHEFSVAVAADNDAETSGEVGEANLEGVEVVDCLVDVGDGGDEGVVDGVKGGVEPEGEKGVAVEDYEEGKEGISDVTALEEG